MVVVVDQVGPHLGFAELQVRGALGRDHVPWHAQRDAAIGRPPAVGELAVVVVDGDLIAEVTGRTGAAVSDQRLFLGQFQLEVITQERPEALFDLLGFGFRSGEPEQGVIGIAGVSEPPVGGIAGVLAGKRTLLFA